MNHYCTYFDRGFLIQGLALWRSLATHDPDATLWVLALDEFTAEVLEEFREPRLRTVRLVELESGDPALGPAKADRTRIEYFFTLSPCWPRWLLAMQPGISRITYLDADMAFFARPAPIFSAMDEAGASVLVTEHRFPPWLRHYERHGRFNVGILAFRNDGPARACLDDWRAKCLAWCHDRLEDGKYADQKYLDDWPGRLGGALLVLGDPGVNAAPWNWAGLRWTREGAALSVAGRPLVLFHFARFRPLAGDRWFQSGQLDYGVMPGWLRRCLYGAYWRGLASARAELATRRPGLDFRRASARRDREYWRSIPIRLAFGSDWLRVGASFISIAPFVGRWSGRVIAALRRRVGVS